MPLVYMRGYQNFMPFPCLCMLCQLDSVLVSLLRGYFLGTMMNSVLDYLDSFAIPESEWEKELEWIDIFDNEKFLAKASITLISADTSSFKTFFTTEFSMPLLKNGVFKKVYDIDFDGDTRVYKERNQNDILKPLRDNKQWIYIRENEIIAKNTSIDVILDDISRKNENLNGVLFIIDVLSNFTNPNDVKEVNRFFGILRRLTNLNATIIVLHHNKKERTQDGLGQYSGVSYLTGKADVAYQLSANDNKEIPVLTFKIIKSKYNYLNGKKHIIFSLDTTKRAGERLSIDTRKSYEEIQNSQSPKRKEIVEKIREVLSTVDQIYQGQLLEKIGTNKNDKTAINVIDTCAKYSEPLWHIKTIAKGNITSKLISLKVFENDV